MALLRFINGLDGFSDPVLLAFSQEVMAKVTNNPYFPNLKPNLSDLNTGVTEYQSAMARASFGNKEDIDIKNEKKATLIGLMHSLMYYILFTTDGNRTIAESSGFTLVKPQTPSVISTPQKVKAQNGDNPGELLISSETVKGARSYLHQYSTDPTLAENSWITMACTSSKCTINGLEIGTKYYCRVAAVGTKDQIKYSNVVWRIVQ